MKDGSVGVLHGRACRVAAAFLGGALALSAVAAPTVSSVSAAFDSTTGFVTVSYSVSEESIVTFDVLSNDVPVGTNRLASAQGDVNRIVASGAHTFRWNACEALKDIPGSKTLTFVVSAWDKKTPPDVLVVDLQDVSHRYYVGLDALPDGITADRYKTTELVFRKIHGTAAGEWTMGSDPSEPNYNGKKANTIGNIGCELRHTVLFTNDWYIGVYPVTQGQFLYLNGSGGYNQSFFYTNANFRAKRPVDNVTYDWLRGNTWPNNLYAGAGGRINSAMRSRTGISNLDLPTEAQWEFSCRAGTTSTYSFGSSLGTNARYKGNDAYPTEGSPNWESYHTSDTNGISLWNYDNGTPEVGSYSPNAFGLYDMHGGVWEYCLDWCEAETVWSTTITYTNPVGCTRGQSYAGCTAIMRGGAWSEDTKYCRSGTRRFQSYTSTPGSKWPGCSSTGFRLAVPEVSPARTVSSQSATAAITVPAEETKDTGDGSRTGLDGRTRTWLESLVVTVSTAASGLIMIFR